MAKSNKFYDVTYIIFTGGYEKSGLSRVCASNEMEAVVSAMEGEVHFIDSKDIRKQIRKQLDSGTDVKNLSIEDDETFIYDIIDIVELQIVKVEVNGEEAHILLPVEGKQTKKRLHGFADYFVD